MYPAMSPKRACVLCGAQSYDLFQEADGPYRVVERKHCTLVYVDPFPTRTELEELPQIVSLAEVKADSEFSDFPLVRLPRLSVMPVTPLQWNRLLAMAGVKSRI